MKNTEDSQEGRLLTPFPVRVPKRMKTRLRDASRRFGLNTSEIIRRAIELQLPKWEQTGEIVITGRDR